MSRSVQHMLVRARREGCDEQGARCKGSLMRVPSETDDVLSRREASIVGYSHRLQSFGNGVVSRKHRRKDAQDRKGRSSLAAPEVIWDETAWRGLLARH